MGTFVFPDLFRISLRADTFPVSSVSFLLPGVSCGVLYTACAKLLAK